jgi:heme/copper-type cytochrome/quinol oxidase subunit 2
VTIDKTELEAKLREIEGVVTDIEEEAKSNTVIVAAVVTVVVVGVVALMVWHSRRSRIRIEVYKK